LVLNGGHFLVHLNLVPAFSQLLIVGPGRENDPNGIEI